MLDQRAFEKLENYLKRVPAVFPNIQSGSNSHEWWVTFDIDIHHDIAWHVVQEFAYVANNLSLQERLPTRFYPSSPPPYLNGGPEEFLSWWITCSSLEFRPGTLADWLEGRLPRPVEDISQWDLQDSDD
ncbi:hypothetical protein [uncultured Roseibium sp.]|uniref:hypothetical protein n=1 Tax=uncultured Roseibium sp. TaxID=1936171 RepID=UPI00262CEFA4|nr:hypothetical protein [uncultured Roseibium sp.]